MSLDISDFRFSTANTPNVFHRFATAGDCISPDCPEEYRKGNFKVDMNGTNFLLLNSIPYSFHTFPPCAQRVFKGSMSSDRRQWSGYCGGHCGNCWPE
ncbi:A disintegrin and metallo ase with thrombospondin motifs 9, partial [Paramuricea clavata]